MKALSEPRLLDPTWLSPSADICLLIRQAAEIALPLISQVELWDQISQHPLLHQPNTISQDDPVLIASLRRANQSSILHWLSATIDHPDQMVDSYLSTDMMHNAHELERLGILEALHSSARTTQQMAWQYWMNIVFQISHNPDEIQTILQYSSRSITQFVDGNLQRMQHYIQEENRLKRHDFFLERRELVLKILDGIPIQISEHSRKLAYPLDAPQHHAAIIWSEDPNTPISKLEQAAHNFEHACHSQQSIKVMISATIFWVWVASKHPISEQLIQQEFKSLSPIRITFSSAQSGIEGFKRAHADAATAQRVLGRLQSKIQVTAYPKIRLVALMFKEPEMLQRYLSSVLGDLRHAPSSISHTLHAFLACGCNIAETAQHLHTHRNTIIRRLERAETLLPQPLSDNRIQISAALDVFFWLSHDDKQGF